MGIRFFNKSKLNHEIPRSTKGYSLVEILVVLAIAGLVAAAIYQVFRSQQKSYTIQDQVAEMQQNLRLALDTMVREIRMAGYDPKELGQFGIVLATSSAMNFTADIGKGSYKGNGKVDPGETFLYQLYDSDHDGKVDALRRTPGGAPLATNMQELEFYYTLDDGTTSLFPTDPEKIRKVQISILARTSRPDKNYTDTRAYTTASGATWGPYNDHYHRRLLITTVKIRNTGLR